MALTCQQCGDELPPFPQEAVEDSHISEIVAHTFDPDGLAVSETAYYCDPSCAAKAFSDD